MQLHPQPTENSLVSETPESFSTILVVEDNLDNLQVIFQMLQGAGYRVLVSTDGYGALQKLRRTAVDLVLLDVMLADLDGFEVCRRLKADDAIAAVPVIFMTALSDISHKVEGFEAGAVDYITKPFQQEEILSRIHLHLKLGHLTRALQAKNEALSGEIAARCRVEAELQKLNQDLEERVVERTQSLTIALDQLRQQEKELQYRAHHDVLTGLVNRIGIIRTLTDCLQQSHAVLFLDLDYFKNINDRFGHFVGDVLLQHVAHRLQDSLPPQDFVGRFGGDEFLIIISRPAHELEAVARQLIEQLQKPFQLGPYSVCIGACIGIVPSTAVYTEVNHILRDADIALYRAKQAGPNTLLVLNYKIQQQAIERITLEAELRIAIDRNQLCLYYQPIFAMADKSLIGFEVLVRWQHPERGILSPNKFIPLAEESGMIQSLDCWVLKCLDQQWQQWQQRGLDLSHLTFNVNLAAVHFQHRDCYCKLDYLLTQSLIPSHCLKLEITETLFIDSSAIALHPMEQLHRKGFHLCIDDFGTGYSSLSRLHSFPVRTLKIDRAFVQNMHKTSGAIVETIITLAHQLNMDVVAEGIETAQQFRQLQQLGCDYGQGYWYSRPLNIEDMQNFLHQGVLVCG